MNAEFSNYGEPIDISSSGGEGWADDFRLDDYALTIGDDFSVYGILGKDLARAMPGIINHLRLNGHKFSFEPDHTSQDQPIVLAYKGNNDEL